MKKKVYYRPESILTHIQVESMLMNSSPLTLDRDADDTTDTSWSNRHNGWNSDSWSGKDAEE